MKTILITGSTDGIGKLVAQKLASAGHEILLHGRDAQKLDAVTAEIKSRSKNEHITGFVADFSDLVSVKKMADAIIEHQTKIDVLINNAGVYKVPVERTKDGYDIRFVVNYLSPVLLTKKLRPALEASEEPRVINLSSAAQSSVSLPALAGIEGIGMQEAYAQSKLALTMWSFDLAKEWSFANIIAVNPGSLLNTKMVKETFGRHWSSAEKGGEILYELALSRTHAAQSGKYFDNDHGAYADAHPDAYDSEKIDQLLSKTNSLIQ